MDRVVSTAAEKALLAKGADAVDMEAAAVAEMASARNLPFYAVRVVTDTWDENFPLDFNRMRSANGHFSRARDSRRGSATARGCVSRTDETE